MSFRAEDKKVRHSRIIENQLKGNTAMTNEEKLRSASVPTLILSMSLPMVLVMLVNVLYNMADVFFMGRTGNTMAVAGVSLTSPIFSGISAFNTLIGFGGCTAVSIALGKGDRDIVRKYTSFVTYAALALGVVLTVLLLSFSEGLLTILGTNEETMQHAKDYLSILALGAPFMLTAGALGNTIRADGESRIPMLVALLTNGLNIALDALFILRLGWGAKGAAAATVISNAVNFIIVLIIAARKPSFSLSPKDFTLRLQVSLNVLFLGIPMAAGTFLMSIAHIFSNRLMVQYGNLAVAASSAAGKVSMLIPMIIMGICMGVQPAMSYAYGMQNRERLHQIALGTGLFALLFGVFLSVFSVVFRSQLIPFFLPDPEVLQLGKRMIIGHVISVPVYAVYQMCSCYLQSVGSVRKATLTSLLRQGIVFIPVVYTMNALFQLNGMIFSSAVSDVISAAIALFLCRLASKEIKHCSNYKSANM